MNRKIKKRSAYRFYREQKWLSNNETSHKTDMLKKLSL